MIVTEFIKRCQDCAVECMSHTLTLQFVHWFAENQSCKKKKLKRDLERKLFILANKDFVKESLLLCSVFTWLILTFVAVKT